MCDHYTNEVNGSAVLTIRWMPPSGTCSLCVFGCVRALTCAAATVVVSVVCFHQLASVRVHVCVSQPFEFMSKVVQVLIISAANIQIDVSRKKKKEKKISLRCRRAAAVQNYLLNFAKLMR